MGHLVGSSAYGRLHQRLDGNPVGAPAHPALFEILSLLFSEDEAAVAAQMPYGFSSTRRLATITGREESELAGQLGRMADRGLLLDIERRGRSYWYLNPLVIGFFEFTMMRVRTDVDQRRLAHKLYEYMFEDPANAFLREVGVAGETQLVRPLVHEEVIASDFVEVMDFERASHLIRSASAWTVGLCHCRHVAYHHDRPCRNSVAGLAEPMEVCLSLGEPAQYFARRGLGRAIESSEAMEILAGARQAGLVQLGDNVQRRANFICSCCACCCELLEGYRRLREQPVLRTSNFFPQVDAARCTGCGLCVKACPVQAITVEPRPESMAGVHPKGVAQASERYCLGCGVCATRCPRKAISMIRGRARVHTPETTLERVMLMALERGKLQNLLFDQPDRLSHSLLRRFVGTLLKMPPARRLLAREQLKSRFVGFLLDRASGRPGADT